MILRRLTVISRNVLLFGAVVALSACERPAQPKAVPPETSEAPRASATSPEKPKGGAMIEAEPNPVPAGPEQGKTVIRWDTGTPEAGEVYLSVDGGTEKVFGKHSKNSQEAPWISAGPVYEFRLYKGTDRAELLGSVKVTRKRQ